MDFSNRSAQPQSVAPSATATTPTATKKSGKDDQSKWMKISYLVLVVAVVVLLIGLIGYVAFGNNQPNEDKYVDSSKLQAVFLQTGQVYFGNVKTLNNKFFVLTNIYYLQTSSSSTSTTSTAANTSVSLVKLGCELHEPYDQMVINRDQVTFWENLQDGGQVATAVKAFEKQNPNGQKCSDQSASSASTSSSVQNAGTSTTGTTTTGTGSTTTTGTGTTTTKP